MYHRNLTYQQPIPQANVIPQLQTLKIIPKNTWFYTDDFIEGNVELTTSVQVIINDISYIIKSYRVHKDYDMVTLDGINSIEEIPFPKNTKVFIDRDKFLDKNDYLDSDLIGFIVYNSKIEREVIDIVYLNDKKKLIKTEAGYIPFELVKKVDLENKKILVEEVEGL